MKTRFVFGMILLCVLSAAAIAPGTAPLAEASSPDLATIAGGSSLSGCFPVDECNICCVKPNGQLICTTRACA